MTLTDLEMRELELAVELGTLEKLLAEDARYRRMAAEVVAMFLGADIDDSPDDSWDEDPEHWK